MGSYIDRIKAANPNAYSKLSVLMGYTNDQNFGGNPDWQAQIFANSNASKLKMLDISGVM